MLGNLLVDYSLKEFADDADEADRPILIRDERFPNTWEGFLIKVAVEKLLSL